MVLGNQLLAQKDTLNQLNSKRKKHGYCIQYLDRNLNPVDSSKAFYKEYALYDNGEILIGSMKNREKKKWVRTTDADTLQQRELANGLFKWLDPKTQNLMLEENYSKGHMTWRKEYVYDVVGGPNICSKIYFWDYSRRYNNILGSCYHEDQDYWIFLKERTKISKYWMTWVDHKWKFISAE